MAAFEAHQGGTFTPVAHATNANNLTLAADTAGDVGMVTKIGWGGRGLTSTGYRTRWGRATTNGVTPTALTVGAGTPNVTNTCTANTYGTAPILAADPTALYATDWNVLFGGGFLVLPVKGGWYVIGTAAPYAQIACGNIAGTEANTSSYMIGWEE
jgi:hypothetical protein